MYTRMKRFITKALSTYSEINYAKFCFHLFHCEDFPCLVGYRRFLLFLLRWGFGGGYLWQVRSSPFISFCCFLWDICRMLSACRRHCAILSYLSDVTLVSLRCKNNIIKRIIFWSCYKWLGADRLSFFPNYGEVKRGFCFFVVHW